MEEPVTDGDDHASHRQLVLVDVVNPISHSISSSSSVTPLSPNSSSFSPNDSSPARKAPGSDGISSNTTVSTKFTLPRDWTVQKVHRKFGGTTDKYYRDPETGRQFRSLKEVERFITEGVTPPKSRLKSPNSHRKKKSGSKDIIIVADKKVDSQDIIVTEKKVEILELEGDKSNENQLATVSPFELPYGWVVKEVPRTSGDYVDKYYFEPGTGQKFRSLIAVQKYLTEIEENSPLSVALEEIRENNLPISKAFKLSTTIKNYGSYSSWKKSKLISREVKATSFPDPPSKINWVIGGGGDGGGDTWNAFINNTLVQDSVKQQWGDTFMMAVTNGKHNG